MSIGKLRRSMYRGASILGDVQAVQRSIEKRSAIPMAERAKRKLLWRTAGKLLRKL